jgi:drug/metabolite transporter (DMT)-like permease
MIAADKIQKQLTIIGVTCGTLAAAAWAGGFVVAKHGIEIGFSPADIAFHRFFWTGILLLPVLLRDLKGLAGVGWGRGLVLTLLSGPPQSLLAYSGFVLVPLGHGTTIQPACAALTGLLLSAVVLGETISSRRMAGGGAIVIGLIIYGAESLTTIGGHGLLGDLLFVSAGIFWATFGILLRQWNVPAATAAVAVATLSLLLYAPVYLALYGWAGLARHGLLENALQAVVQGGIAGVLAIYLFTHAVIALGAGRAATFPALVPVFGVIIGLLALGVVPSLAQLIGLLIVLIGFRLTMR